MTLSRRISVLSTFLILLFTTSAFTLKGTLADVKFHSQSLSLLIKGTSTLHDWEMKSAAGRCDVLLVLDNGDKLTGVSGLSFSVQAETLKSGHSMMDNNTYKALKTGANKNITFVLSSARVTPVNATTYGIKATGKLTIAGTAKDTELNATAKYNAADKSFTVTGTKDMKMSDWGVKPPTVMMGTIKTGDAVSISFNTKIVR